MKKSIEKEVATDVEQCIVPETFQFILENHYDEILASKNVSDIDSLCKADTVIKVMRLSPYKVPTIKMGIEIVFLAASLLKSKM